MPSGERWVSGPPGATNSVLNGGLLHLLVRLVLRVRSGGI